MKALLLKGLLPGEETTKQNCTLLLSSLGFVASNLASSSWRPLVMENVCGFQMDRLHISPGLDLKLEAPWSRDLPSTVGTI